MSGDYILRGTTAKYGRPSVWRIRFIGGPADGSEYNYDSRVKCRRIYIPYIDAGGTISKLLYVAGILTPHEYHYQEEVMM